MNVPKAKHAVSLVEGLTCERAIEVFQDALDERLRADERPLELLVHLADCAACRKQAAELSTIDRVGSRLARGFEPGRFVWTPERVMAMAAAVLVSSLSVACVGRGLVARAVPLRAVPRGMVIDSVERVVASLEARDARLREVLG